MKAIIKRFLKEETGVTAIEYGLIAGLIAVWSGPTYLRTRGLS
ncbi:hypothetical protein C6T57_03125 [Burkholderia multivorans]|nr:hypothetical protein C6T57_03125 [Burkholderia multivorans]